MSSINEQRYRAKLEEVLASYSLSLVSEVRKFADEALKNIQSGMPANQAIDKALNSTGFFIANNTAVIDAIYLSACAGYRILSEIVADPGVIKAKLLNGLWTGDGIKLSERLHGTSKQMRTDIIDTISASMRKQDTCVEMARKLYDGYGADKVINQSHLPKYLDNLSKSARSVAQGNSLSQKEFEKALSQAEYQLNKLARNGAPTLALKDGHSLIVEASKALGNGAMDPKKLEALKRKLKRQGLDSVADLNQAINDLNAKALDKAVRVAIEERTRYHAERIARTESARAWFDGFIAEHEGNPDIVAYKWQLSSRHKHLPFDICDVYANADFGLGVGIFPKYKVPNIPVHPHCLCSLGKVYKGELPEGARFHPGKASEYIDNLPDDKLEALFGVQGAKERSADWTKLARGHSGFGKPASRLSVDDFKSRLPNTDNNAKMKSDMINKAEEVRKQIISNGPSWKPGSLERHLIKCKRWGHVSQNWTESNYNNKIVDILKDENTEIYLYYQDGFPQNYFVYGLPDWIVMVGENGVMESAYIIDRNKTYSEYLAVEFGYMKIETVGGGGHAN